MRTVWPTCPSAKIDPSGKATVVLASFQPSGRSNSGFSRTLSLRSVTVIRITSVRRQLAAHDWTSWVLTIASFVLLGAMGAISV